MILSRCLFSINRRCFYYGEQQAHTHEIYQAKQQPNQAIEKKNTLMTATTNKWHC